ncbi:MAG: TIGR03905 family TSCPD domain-containing protein [Firmicutes bacterium]|nr:TIGR03905 family TSCPD domain-containing protein [Bacillota bacterium]
MKHTYIPRGVCSTKVDFELDGNIVKNVHFSGGCNGNLKAISALVEGMPVEEVTKKLSGITCGMKSTSCTDQLSAALKQAVEASKNGADSNQ